MQTYIYESTSLCINITVHKNYNTILEQRLSGKPSSMNQHHCAYIIILDKERRYSGAETKLHQCKRHLATWHLLHHSSLALTSLEPLLALILCFYTIEIWCSTPFIVVMVTNHMANLPRWNGLPAIILFMCNKHCITHSYTHAHITYPHRNRHSRTHRELKRHKYKK